MTLECWNVVDGAAIGLELPPKPNAFNGFCRVPNSPLFVLCHSDGETAIWDSATGESKATLPTTSEPNHPTVSPDGEVVALASRQAITFWSLQDYEERAVLNIAGRGIGSPAFAPDGRTIVAVAGAGMLRFLSVPDVQ